MRTLFRPLSIMQPDLEYIAGIKLLCFGYKNAKSLGSKIVIVLNLCRKQLLAVPHHHFGNRTVNMILKNCEMEKGAEKTEERIVVAAIRRTITGMLNHEETMIFDVSVCILKFQYFLCYLNNL